MASRSVKKEIGVVSGRLDYMVALKVLDPRHCVKSPLGSLIRALVHSNMTPGLRIRQILIIRQEILNE